MPLDRLLLRPPEWFEAQAVTCLTASASPPSTAPATGDARLGPQHSLRPPGAGHRLHPAPAPAAVTKGLSGLHTVRNISDIDRMAL